MSPSIRHSPRRRIHSSPRILLSARSFLRCRPVPWKLAFYITALLVFVGVWRQGEHWKRFLLHIFLSFLLYQTDLSFLKHLLSVHLRPTCHSLEQIWRYTQRPELVFISRKNGEYAEYSSSNTNRIFSIQSLDLKFSLYAFISFFQKHLLQYNTNNRRFSVGNIFNLSIVVFVSSFLLQLMLHNIAFT